MRGAGDHISSLFFFSFFFLFGVFSANVFSSLEEEERVLGGDLILSRPRCFQRSFWSCSCTNYESGVAEVGGGSGRVLEACRHERQALVFPLFRSLVSFLSVSCFFSVTLTKQIPSLFHSFLSLILIGIRRAPCISPLLIFQYKYLQDDRFISFFVTFIGREEARGARGMEEETILSEVSMETVRYRHSRRLSSSERSRLMG